MIKLFILYDQIFLTGNTKFLSSTQPKRFFSLLGDPSPDKIKSFRVTKKVKELRKIKDIYFFKKKRQQVINYFALRSFF